MREEHLHLLQQTKTRQSNLQVQAGWAAGEWASCVAGTLAFLSRRDALVHLGFVDTKEETDIQPENVQTYFTLMVEAASQRGWNMSVWSEIPPCQFASIMHEDLAVAKSGLTKLKGDAETIEDAFAVANGPGEEQKARSDWHIVCSFHVPLQTTWGITLCSKSNFLVAAPF
jgi:hypothetical protein